MKIIESEHYLIKIHDNDFTEYMIKDGVMYNESVARHTKNALEKYKKSAKFYVLAEGQNFFRVTKGARKLGADKEFSNHLAAVAFYSTNVSLSLLGELYIKINKPAVTTKLFTNRENAEEWLRSLISANNSVSSAG